MHKEIPKHFNFLWLVRFERGGASGQQPSVSLTRSDLFMKPTKVPPAETRGHLAPWGPIRYSTSSGRVLRPRETPKPSPLKAEQKGAQLHISSEKIFKCLSFFLKTWLHWLIRSRVCAQSAHSCRVAMDTTADESPPTLPPRWWKALPCMNCAAWRPVKVFTCLSDNTAACLAASSALFSLWTWLIPTTVETIFFPLLPPRSRNAPSSVKTIVECRPMRRYRVSVMMRCFKSGVIFWSDGTLLIIWLCLWHNSVWFASGTQKFCGGFSQAEEMLKILWIWKVPW